MHIPKTAGTSLRLILEKNIKKNSIFPNSDFISRHGGYPVVGELKNHLSQIKSSRVFLGHYPFRWAEKNIPNFQKITFLRDPIDRTISHLRHIKIHQSAFSDKSLEEILTDGHMRRQFENLQTRYLVDSDVKGYIESKHLEQAKANLDTFYYVGLSNSFETELKELSGLLGITKVNNIKSNVYSEKGEAFQNDNFEPSTDLVNKIIEMNQFDIELYNYIKVNRKQN